MYYVIYHTIDEPSCINFDIIIDILYYNMITILTSFLFDYLTLFIIVFFLMKIILSIFVTFLDKLSLSKKVG